jgi:hypothetical protein
VFSHFNSILGDFKARTHGLNFGALALPVLPPIFIEHCFSEEEVWAVIRDMPADKALGSRRLHRPILQIHLVGDQGRHHERLACLLVTGFLEFLLG